MKHLSDPAIFGQKCYGQSRHQGGPGGPPATPQNLQDCPVLVIILNMSTRDRKTLHSELKYCVSFWINCIQFFCHAFTISRRPFLRCVPALFCFWCAISIFLVAPIWKKFWRHSWLWLQNPDANSNARCPSFIYSLSFLMGGSTHKACWGYFR